MKQEEKKLLLQNLCSRITYGIKCTTKLTGYNDVYTVKGVYEDNVFIDCPVYEEGDDEWMVESIIPFFRPMSSMTEDEREEIEVFIFNEWYEENYCKIDKEGWIEILANYDVSGIAPCFCSDYVNWLNAHHFDYLGLIEKGLALEAPEGMYKTE